MTYKHIEQRVFEQTEAMLNFISSYDLLNAVSLQAGENRYQRKMERFINTCVQRLEFGEGDLVKLYGADHQFMPIVLKIPNPYYSPRHARSMERAHRKHVELLGTKFVEDMTPINITNPHLLTKIKKQYESFIPLFPIRDFPQKVPCFCQDLRGKNGHESLYLYIVHNYKTMSPRIREEIFEFLDRIEKAINRGYYFDIPEDFPDADTNPEDDRKLNGVTNIFVDQEGPSFIDSSILCRERCFTREHKIQKQSIALAKKLISGKVSLQESYMEMKNFLQTIYTE